MFKHMIWDFDGTLFDSYPVMGRTFMEALNDKGIEEPLEEILKQMKVSMGHAIKHYESKYGIDRNFVEQYEVRRKEMEKDLLIPFDGIVEICRYVYTSGRSNYLFTHRGKSAISFMQMHGMYEYFADFITSQNGFERKPSPDAINYLIDKYNMSRDEAIMLGDRDLDIMSGKNAGIYGCFFSESGRESKVADFNIRSFKELYSIID